ncbi:transposase [Streptomyces sp. cf124]|nr:transposase [Streptomyces sp. cf124]
MVAEVRPDYPTEWAALEAGAANLGIWAAAPVRTGSARSKPMPASSPA